MERRKEWANSPAAIVGAAVLNGLGTAAIALAVFWIAPQLTHQDPIDSRIGTIAVVAMVLGSMAYAVWSRRPGQPRQGLFR